MTSSLIIIIGLTSGAVGYLMSEFVILGKMKKITNWIDDNARIDKNYGKARDQLEVIIKLLEK